MLSEECQGSLPMLEGALVTRVSILVDALVKVLAMLLVYEA